MKRNNRLKIFPKTFISCLFLILGVIIIAFFMICTLMPEFYKSYKETTLKSDLKQLVSELNEEDIETIKKKSAEFAQQHGYFLSISDTDGNRLSSYGLEMVATSYTDSVTEDSTSVAVIEILQQQQQLTAKNGKQLIIGLNSSMQPIDEASKVILMVLPIVLLICLFLAIIISFIYAKTITNPIKAISNATIDMKTLQRDAICLVRSHDEIGELAQNVNELYVRLLTSIDELQEEFQNIAVSDQKKIDFMLAVSHELKTPLTAVKGMLECMIYNVGIYKDRDTYLVRCAECIDEMTVLLSDILDASRLELSPSNEDYKTINLNAVVNDVSACHKLIAMSKKISIHIEIDSTVTLSLPEQLFSKALSNIISNAIKYTQGNESINILFETGKLIIENPCEPLSNEELERIFEPFYRASSKEQENTGHGLGLYITERILTVCNLPFEFIPFSNGMQFIIYLQP